MLIDQIDQEIKQLNTAEFKQMLIVATKKLKEAEEEVNDLNIYPVPDGDTGSNMYLTLSNAVEEVKKTNSNTVGDLADKLSMGALMGARGNSGVILSQLLKGLANGMEDSDVLTVDNLSAGLQQAADIAYQAVMKPVEGTILTVAREIAEKAEELSDVHDLTEFMYKIVKQARESVAKTPQLLEVLDEAGVVDAGGKGYEIFLRGLLEGMLAEEEEFEEIFAGSFALGHTKEEQESEEKFGYCTEFIVKGAEVEVDEFREKISALGDSLVVVKTQDLLKVHIHTDHPGEALEFGIEYGDLTNIKIDNMSEQHHERIRQEAERDAQEQATKEDPKDGEIDTSADELAVLAVTVGDGLQDIFDQIGAHYVLKGGQSFNPSTKDLLNGIEKIDASDIIILPNNKNVISTAKQVKDLTEKNIEIVPTKTVPQGIAAMMMFNPQGELSAVSDDMKEELEYVKTGEITYAVRDTEISDMKIEKGDILGLQDGDIEVVTGNYNQAALNLIDHMVEDLDSLITIYVGEETTAEKKEELIDKLEEKYPDFDLEVHTGGQPIYYYIISVE
ncbi:DAK2 domain-containing protein [Halanaerobacter jeridensis]|uniref:DAK2 domain fusion protein YloV n=1 Tax=Halanaerobacter jeridensis TaxID=706427 RepID=A0A939BQK6_9FIRM|nr:DAK2 domain-containing protein [Halanaerobacter jeridensis]MBM7556434.1 DAK2 domain fusion protein YloV [Halanaerobacter jeridensis]